jgi:exodeoxyribonuclease VII large subunit
MGEALSLYDLNRMVRSRLKSDFPNSYWVQAEISDIKEHFSGHCYLELVQKKESGDAICAKCRATIWSNVWMQLRPTFEQLTGTKLQSGQKILAEVVIDFHELFGYSLIVKNIDPTFTVGDLRLRRLEVIKKLKDEGVFELNKELDWPEIPRTLAIVSAPGAAGFGDFMNQLQQNPYGFTFSTHFFPAVMQGDAAGDSIRGALDQIMEASVSFDLVVIIRGGGATTDLQCFDQYDLCYYAAQYPLPLLTGIGHERDSSVLDEVAHTSVKTPTAAAEYLIDQLSRAAYRMDALQEQLLRLVKERLDKYRVQLQSNSEKLQRLASDGLLDAKMYLERTQVQMLRLSNEQLLNKNRRLELLQNNVQNTVLTLLNQQRHRLELCAAKVDAHSPELMIQKGFTLTAVDGKIIKSVRDLKPGHCLETTFSDGVTQSTVIQIQTKDESN